MDAISDFLQDPLVIPLVSLLILAGLNFLLGVYRAWQQGQFDWEKLPQLLDTVVLRKVIPLAARGMAAAFVDENAIGAGLMAAYVTGTVAAVAAEAAALIKKVTDEYMATRADGLVHPIDASPDGGPVDRTP
jgi:hypothetical protein